MSWIVNDGINGVYDEVVSFGFYVISSGDVILFFIDDVDEECIVELMIFVFEICFDQCLIMVFVSNYQCDDNNIFFDLEDDFFIFDFIVEVVNNVGLGWIQFFGNNGEYGVVYMQGLFLIVDGLFNMVVEDVVDVSCIVFVVINLLLVCLDDCMLFVEVEVIYCDDNGILEDMSDDEFIYVFLVIGVNIGDFWIVSDGMIGSYGEVVEFIVGYEYVDGLL